MALADGTDSKGFFKLLLPVTDKDHPDPGVYKIGVADNAGQRARSRRLQRWQMKVMTIS